MDGVSIMGCYVISGLTGIPKWKLIKFNILLSIQEQAGYFYQEYCISMLICTKQHFDDKTLRGLCSTV